MPIEPAPVPRRIGLSPRWVQWLTAALLSGLMSATVSLVSTIRGFGFPADLIQRWLHAWSVSWPVAFLVLLIVGKPVRRWVARLGAVDSE